MSFPPPRNRIKQSFRPSSDSGFPDCSREFSELLARTRLLVLEEEAVQQEQISEQLIRSGEHLQRSLLTAEQTLGSSQHHVQAAQEFCIELNELRTRLESVLARAKLSARPASPSQG